jgi:HK97 family phage prohead protease
MKPKLERKVTIVQKASAGDDGTGSFEGYGSTFGHVDSYGDRIMPGAYADTIENFLKRGASLLSHDWASLPIGTITEAKEDSIGLWLLSHYHSIQSAQDARTVAKERIDRGANVGLSIVTSAESFVKRSQAIHALRAKDGRDVSTASKERIQKVAESLSKLTEELTGFDFTTPVQDSSTIGERVQGMKMRSMRVQHLLRSTT